jgi:urease accessory protein
MPTAPSTVTDADRSVTTRIAVERAGERHRIFARPGLIRTQTIRNDARSCRIGLLATSALLLGGDQVVIEVEVGPGANLELFDVAGTVAYHGRGQPAAWHTTARVADGGTLRWAGEPFVVADGADVLRTLELELDAYATLRLRETVVLGRSGEVGGRLRTRTGIRVDGEPVLLEDQRLDPSGLRRCPGMLGDHRVIDSLLAVGGSPSAPPPGAVRFGLIGDRGSVTRYLGSGLAESPLNRWPEVR